DDIVEVKCTHYWKTVYHFLHSQIWKDVKESDERYQSSTSRNVSDTKPSVYIFVMDSFGSSHARRVFPKTLNFLKKEFGAVEMLHMNKVGENTRPNGYALLMGKLINDIRKSMYGLADIPADLNNNEYCQKHIDHEGFVLEEFSKRGYKTLMSEDWANGIFNWPDCVGFKKQPTTHYMRPFQLFFDKNHKSLDQYQGIANCFEPHQFINDYMEKFIKAYPDEPKAVLNWAVTLGHDDANVPFHADGDYLRLFERNKEEFDKSIVIFMGDHGLRFGKILSTPIGQRDVNNPMLHISVPSKLRRNEALMRNLKENSQKLLTMFDLHATILDIAQSFSDPANIDFNKARNTENLKGSSILRPLPAFLRNCKTLPIPLRFCICKIDKNPL
ncbi:hypothetical protein PFISCL1PPCAC_9785, partial [Pristionchus fissidentatus]